MNLTMVTAWLCSCSSTYTRKCRSFGAILRWAAGSVILLSMIGCSGPSSDQQLPERAETNTTGMVAADTSRIQNQPAERDTLHQYSNEIRRNESFYRIFNRLEVSPQRIHTLTTEFDSLLDQFEMKPGQPYRYTVLKKDSNKHLFRFVWEPTKRDYLVFHFNDTLSVVHHQESVNKKIATAAGKIESSLYETFLDNDLPLELAFEMSDLYAWEIDFFLLRSGDAFKVLYEQIYVDGKKIGIGNILAAEFRHRGKSYKAYRFFNGSKMGYYDPEGKSLQKALLKAPLDFRYISSGFSHSRYHPILNRRMPHYGIDYVAPRGTPVVSVGDGTVITAGYKGPNGNMLKIRHNGTYTTTYIHLSRFANGIHRGAKVKQGEVIGYVGNTGRSTGSHLDYRLYKYGDPVNPRKVELPPTDGIDDSYMTAFQYSRKQMDRILNRLTWKDSSHSSSDTQPSTVSNIDEDDAGKSS